MSRHLVYLLRLRQWSLNQHLRPRLQHLNLSLSQNQLRYLTLHRNLRLQKRNPRYLWKSHQLLKSNRLSKNRLHLPLQKNRLYLQTRKSNLNQSQSPLLSQSKSLSQNFRLIMHLNLQASMMLTWKVYHLAHQFNWTTV
jgi:hypothetical protein